MQTRRSAITTIAMVGMIIGTGVIALTLTRAPLAAPGPPHCAALAIHTPSAKLPPIGAFDDLVNTVPDNPFVFHEPALPPPPGNPGDPTPDSPSGSQPPAPPPPPLNLPKAPDLRTDAPICHGLVSVGALQVALVTMPGDGKVHQMTVGESIPAPIPGNSAGPHPPSWTLIGVTAGNLAHWRDPAGNEQTFAIANGVDATIASSDGRHGRATND